MSGTDAGLSGAFLDRSTDGELIPGSSFASSLWTELCLFRQQPKAANFSILKKTFGTCNSTFAEVVGDEGDHWASHRADD